MYPTKKVMWLPDGGAGGGEKGTVILKGALAGVKRARESLESGICRHIYPEALGVEEEAEGGEDTEDEVEVFIVEGQRYRAHPDFACHPSVKQAVRQLVKDLDAVRFELQELAMLPREGLASRVRKLLSEHVSLLDPAALPSSLPDALKGRLAAEAAVASDFAQRLQPFETIPEPGSSARISFVRKAWRALACGLGLGCFEADDSWWGCFVAVSSAEPTEEQQDVDKLHSDWRHDVVDPALASRVHKRAVQHLVLLPYSSEGSREILAHTGG